eukprot:15443962-Alexandrium_andersonii.AAC.1
MAGGGGGAPTLSAMSSFELAGNVADLHSEGKLRGAQGDALAACLEVPLIVMAERRQRLHSGEDMGGPVEKDSSTRTYGVGALWPEEQRAP